MVRSVALPLALIFLPWLLLQLLSNPSCKDTALNERPKEHAQLVVMVVGDLHLAGPRTVWTDRFLRYYFMKTSFKKAYRTLKPHALLVLGDISDWGRKSTDEQWMSVVMQYRALVEPYSGLPIHVTVGNHDVGDFYQLTPALLHQFVNSFPGMDETGSEIFTINNVTFVSLNTMALACDGCPLHSSMQRVVEKAETILQQGSSSTFLIGPAEGEKISASSTENALENPVLLLHLPLHRIDESVCHSFDIPRCAPWHEVEGGCSQLGISTHSSQLFKLTPYRSMVDMLSLNTSRYLLSVLNPRLVLSAHSHRFCDRVHDSGTREVTVPTFSYRNRDDPGFLLLLFYKTGATHIQQCFLPRESVVIGLHVLQWIALLAVIATCGIRYRSVQKRIHLKA